MSIRTLITGFLFILASTVQAQKIFFEQLTTAEGLPSDYVNQVYEDSKGYLWIATDKGACRYDGRNFQLFNKENGLPDNFVICFAEDDKGQVWIGTYEGGLCKFDGSKIVSSPFDQPGYPKTISQIHVNADNSLLVITRDLDLYYFANESAKPQVLFHQLNYLARLSANKFLTASDSDQFILRRSGDKYLLEKTLRYKEQLLIKPWLNSEKCLVQKGDELCVYDRVEEKFIFNRRLHVKMKSPIFEIKDYDFVNEKLLIATTHGLIYIDREGRQFLFSSSNGLGSDYVNNICSDRKGNIYLCTFGGGIKMWRGVYMKEYEINGKVTSIFPLNKKVFITSTQANVEYDLTNSKMSSFYTLAKGNFTSFYQSPNGTIYLGSLVNYFRLPNENAWRGLNEKNKTKYVHFANQGTSGFQYRKDKLYVATYGDGVMVFDNNHAPIDTLKFESGIVEALVPLKSGIAALSYSAGVALIDSQLHMSMISKSDGLLSNTVYSVYQENESELWIGTLHGLNRWIGNKVTNAFSYEEGLNGSRVVCIFRDRQKRFWVVSDKFLHLLEFGRLRAIRSHPIVFDAKKSINRAVYCAETDQLFIGFTNALAIISMNEIQPESTPSGTSLAGVIADSSTVVLKHHQCEISSGTKKITLEFTDATRQLSGHSDIYYKMSPFDEDWRLLGDNLQAEYQKIPAGQYQLLAKTVSADGVDSAPINLGNLKVLPPFWKETWFALLSITLLVAVVYLSGHFISRARYKRRLKELQAEYRLQLERERIARELHDNVGSQLTYLINKIDDDYLSLANSTEASKLSNYARGTMQELRETIWALDKKEIQLNELEYKVRQLVKLYRDNRINTEMEWITANPSTSIHSLKALNIYRIIQESVNNAEKYSQASLIKVRAHQSDGIIQISVDDNGKGFTIETAKEGYGLKNIKKRAEEINAHLEITSAPGKGTSVSLIVHAS